MALLLKANETCLFTLVNAQVGIANDQSTIATVIGKVKAIIGIATLKTLVHNFLYFYLKKKNPASQIKKIYI